jgi:K+/H+ antiporter YhaU regulatory subunit KhtT
MSVPEKVKAAMKGTREMRAVLIRDPNRMVAVSVLSCPKVNEQEIETFARMTNVSEDILRTIGQTRAWTKNYAIVAALVRNAKTPVAVSMTLLQRLTDRDVRAVSTDRNVPEPLRVAARRRIVQASERK